MPKNREALRGNWAPFFCILEGILAHKWQRIFGCSPHTFAAQGTAHCAEGQRLICQTCLSCDSVPTAIILTSYFSLLSEIYCMMIIAINSPSLWCLLLFRLWSSMISMFLLQKHMQQHISPPLGAQRRYRIQGANVAIALCEASQSCGHLAVTKPRPRLHQTSSSKVWTDFKRDMGMSRNGDTQKWMVYKFIMDTSTSSHLSIYLKI